MQSIIGYMKPNTKKIVAGQLSKLMDVIPALSTQQKLAARTGIGQTTIGRIRRGEVNATSDNLRRIAEAFGVPVSYLYGETDQRGVPPEGQRQLEEQFIRDADKHHEEQSTPKEFLSDRLPLITWEQAALWNNPSFHFSSRDAIDWLSWPGQPSPRSFVLEVAGESMYDPKGPKSYAPGDYIAVDPEEPPRNRCTIVLVLDGDTRATFRQVIMDERGPMLFLALNPDVPNKISAVTDKYQIIGVVIGKWVKE